MAQPDAVPPFMGAVKSASPQGFSAAIFGAPHGTPYPGIDNRIHRGAPDAFRHALRADADWLSHWDWDLGGPLLKRGQTVCDLGNLKTRPKDGPGNRALIESTTRSILEAGAVPIMFGGDDSVPIPFIAAFSNQPAIVILQIDAHIDWRHERDGESMGFSSTMRRASEHDHVWRIVQAGARGPGQRARSRGARRAALGCAYRHLARHPPQGRGRGAEAYSGGMRLRDLARLRCAGFERDAGGRLSLARRPQLHAGDGPDLGRCRQGADRRLRHGGIRAAARQDEDRRLHRRAHRRQCDRPHHAPARPAIPLRP